MSAIQTQGYTHLTEYNISPILLKDLAKLLISTRLMSHPGSLEMSVEDKARHSSADMMKVGKVAQGKEAKCWPRLVAVGLGVSDTISFVADDFQ